MAPLVPDTRPPTTEAPETVHRTVRVRLYPGDAATVHRLAGTAGACRHVWNAILADYDLAYRMWRAFGKLGPGPGPQNLHHLWQAVHGTAQRPGARLAEGLTPLPACATR